MLTERLHVLTFMLAFCTAAQAAGPPRLSVDEIVTRHIQALGGKEKLDAIQSVITRGEYREGTFSISGAFMARMRPYYKTICDQRVKISDVCEGYDGSAWEWYEDPGVVVRTVGPAAAAARHGTDLFDSLVDYKPQGTKIELIGDETFGGKPAYNLHVTLADGFEKHLLVDQQTFLIIGDRRAAPIHAFGDPVRSENRVSDYRQVEGVLFSFLVVEVEISTGRELNRFTTQSMEVNSRLDPSFFAPPQYARTPVQQFLEQLYMERTDPVSLLFTYRQFRSANPTLDTRDGVEFIGYQMAKMSDFNGAVELLKANAADYPKSASAQYGLGRAYKAVGEVENARGAFQRALQIDPGFKKAAEGLNALR
jgi:hypothetical protein